MKKCCKCSCHQKNYEFKLVCDDDSIYNPHPGKISIHIQSGISAYDAMRDLRTGLGNFWSIQGFRRVGSKRWNGCYLKPWQDEDNWWPEKYLPQHEIERRKFYEDQDRKKYEELKKRFENE